MTPRTHEAISVGPMGNLNGTYNFFENWVHPKMSQVKLVPHVSMGDKHSQQVEGGGGSNKTWYRAKLDFKKFTKDKFVWDIEDNLDGFIDTDPGSHPDISA